MFLSTATAAAAVLYKFISLISQAGASADARMEIVDVCRRNRLLQHGELAEICMRSAAAASTFSSVNHVRASLLLPPFLEPSFVFFAIYFLLPFARLPAACLCLTLSYLFNKLNFRHSLKQLFCLFLSPRISLTAAIRNFPSAAHSSVLTQLRMN
jgi:hypothetical protein